MSNRLRFVAQLGLVFLGIASCKKDEPGYDVPATYNFSNVNTSEQSEHMAMLEEMAQYMETAQNGSVLDPAKLRDMFANRNQPFSQSFSHDLKSYTFQLDTTFIISLFDSIALESQSTVAGAPGIAGIVTSSSNPSKKYLCSASGMDRSEVIEKLIMGACFYFQMTATYLSEDEIGQQVDNQTVIPGEGTAMEHHWDEAFGYFGVPIDFPSNKTGIQFFGEYSDERDPLLSCNATLMNAFLKGRAAISNKDMAVKDAQVPVIRQNMEKIVAASAIHYMNAANQNLGDDALRNHYLSEGWAMIWMLKYNPAKTITQTQIDSWLNLLSPGFYTVSGTTLLQIRNEIATAAGMESIQSQL